MRQLLAGQHLTSPDFQELRLVAGPRFPWWGALSQHRADEHRADELRIDQFGSVFPRVRRLTKTLLQPFCLQDVHSLTAT